MIKNIIFDFGGVLYDIRYQNISDSFKRYGFKNFDSIFSKEHQNEIIDQYEVGNISTEQFRAYIHAVSSTPLTDQQIDDAWNAILIGFPAHHEELLQRVHQNYATFLFSNTNQLHYERFSAILQQQFGYNLLERHFNQCYLSQQIHIRKPHKEGFLKILEENLLIPSETLFIDDSPQHIEGAKQCGLHTFHLPDNMDVAELFDSSGKISIEF